MSGTIGSIKSRSGVLVPKTDQPWQKIHQDTFVFQYGGATWTTGYTLPQDTSNQTGLNSRKMYWARTSFGDGRWNSDMTVLSSPTNQFYHVRHNSSSNYLTVSTGGLISVINQNGGSSGNFVAELRVWLLESFEFTGWNYGGGT